MSNNPLINFYNEPLGVRENNPGNLQPGGQEASYPNMTAGYKAMDNNLLAYQKQGLNTITQIVNKWAPASAGNDVNSYIRDVSSRLGLAPDQPLDLNNPQIRLQLEHAMAIHENGPNVAPPTLPASQVSTYNAPTAPVASAPASTPGQALVQNQQVPAPAQPYNFYGIPQGTGAAIAGGIQGATLGLAPKISAAANAVIDQLSGNLPNKPGALTQRYEDYRDQYNKELQGAQQNYPATYTGMNIAGAAVPMAALGVAGRGLAAEFPLTSSMPNVAGGAIAGAAGGAAEGAGQTANTSDELINNIGENALAGAASGTLSGVLGAGAQGFAQRYFAKPVVNYLANEFPQSDLASVSPNLVMQEAGQGNVAFVPPAKYLIKPGPMTQKALNVGSAIAGGAGGELAGNYAGQRVGQWAAPMFGLSPSMGGTIGQWVGGGIGGLVGGGTGFYEGQELPYIPYKAGKTIATNPGLVSAITSVPSTLMVPLVGEGTDQYRQPNPLLDFYNNQ